MMAKTPDADDGRHAQRHDVQRDYDGYDDGGHPRRDDAPRRHDRPTVAPAWFSAALTEATSGATFTLQDYKGKVVLVETMASVVPHLPATAKGSQGIARSVG